MKVYNSVSEDFNWFEYFSDELHLSKETVENAERMFNEQVDGLIREDELILVTLCMYVSARQNEETRSIRQFSNIVSDTIFNKRRDDTADQIKDAYNKIKKKLDLRMKTPHPKEQIDYIAKELDIDDDTLEESKDLIEDMIDNIEFTGRSAVCLSGSAILVKTDYSAEEVCEVTITGKSTLLNIRNLIEEEELVEKTTV